MILYFLNEHKYRFNELSKRLSGVTQASLTKQLRSLEQAGLVERHVYMEIPPKVEYSLSELGKEFSKVLSAIQLFGTTYNQWLAEQKTDSDKAISG
jgi:DNA-binding HxlR family transcriptional regulator